MRFSLTISYARLSRQSLVVASSVLLAASFALPTSAQAPDTTPPAAADPGHAAALASALALVPPDAIAFILVPAPKRASDDLQQCILRMDRPEATLGGRPIDQLKAQVGISASFDDYGPFAISLFPPVGERNDPRFVASFPATDPAAFLAGNFTAAPDVAPDAYKRSDGSIWYAKTGPKHAHLSTDAATVRGFDPQAGIGIPVRERLGARGSLLMEKGDIIAWAGSAMIRPALAAMATQAEANVPADAPFADRMEAMRSATLALAEGIDSGLIVIDLDPLGVGLRSFATFSQGSELAALTVGGKDREVQYQRLPKKPFYALAKFDIDGLGGAAAFDALLAKIPGLPALPAWLSSIKGAVRGAQMAIYPSKLGLAAGGLLNDAVLVFETEKPAAIRDGLRDAVLSTKGEFAGLKREPAWESDRTLKSGDVVDAFEVTETVVAAPDAKPVDVSMQRIISQAIYGSRGFVGFVKPLNDAVIMTFSQRTDVLGQALKASSGQSSLANDPTIAAYREWLIDRPDVGRADVEGFIGVGQFGELFRQAMQLVPGGADAPIPQIPKSTEPIAFALEVDRGTFEGAVVLPSTVIALGFDQIKAQLMGGGAARPAAPASKDANASGQSP